MKRIAVFGGSFNPIHNGHINLVEEYNKIYNFDKILIIPNNIPPHKKLSGDITNKDRFNMCIFACENNSLLEVSDIEIKSGEISYTINTIEKLTKIYRDSEIYLIIGSDMLYMFHEWYKYEDILKKCKILCGSRYRNEMDRLREYKRLYLCNNDNVIIDNINIIEISSSEVRDNIYKNPNYVKTLICSKVYEYILKNKLYK